MENKVGKETMAVKSSESLKNVTRDRIFLILLAEFIAYVVIWSFIAISKLMAIHAYALDLGVFQQSLYLLLHPVTSASWITSFLNAPIRLILSPLALTNSFFPVLIIQTIFIALPVFPLYVIGKHFLKEKIAPALIASSYLIFYGIAGVNWYDVHGQAFFIFFFIAGYAFFLKRNYLYSFLFFTISGLVRFPYEIFPALFGFLVVIQIIFKRGINDSLLRKREMKFSLILFCSQSSLIILTLSITQFLTGSFIGSFGYVHAASPSQNYLIGELLTLPLFLGPFLLFPLYRNRWFLFMIPFFFLVFYADYNWYVYPWILWDQYASGIVPFLYLGTIEGIARFQERKKRPHTFGHRVTGKLTGSSRIAIVILVVIALLALFFQPYGPLNTSTSANFNFSEKTEVNMTRYVALNSIVDLIPRNNPYVFFQDNIPEVLLMDPSVSTTGFAAGIAGLAFPYNLSYQLLNGSWTNKIDYAIFDYNSRFFYYEGTYPTNLSYYQVVQKLYSSGHYGLMANEYGFVLLKRNYNGPLIYGTPFKADLSPTTLDLQGPFESGRDNVSWHDSLNTPNFESSDLFLIPGHYNIELTMRSSDISSLNSFLLNLTDTSSHVLISSSTITGKTFVSTSSLSVINVSVTVPNFYDSVKLSAYTVEWYGTLSLYAISIIEY